MAGPAIPPHLTIAGTVTEEEFGKARWQHRVTRLGALGGGTKIVRTKIVRQFAYGDWGC